MKRADDMSDEELHNLQHNAICLVTRALHGINAFVEGTRVDQDGLDADIKKSSDKGVDATKHPDIMRWAAAYIVSGQFSEDLEKARNNPERN